MKILTWFGKALGVVPHSAGLIKEPPYISAPFVPRKPSAVAELIEVRAQRKKIQERTSVET